MYYGNRGRSARMETASLTLGILSLVCCTCIYVSIIFGALAILFGVLSKGGSNSMSSKALAGFILGIIGIVFTVVFYTYSFATVLDQFGSLEGMMRYYCDMTGLDYDTYFKSYQSL